MRLPGSLENSPTGGRAEFSGSDWGLIDRITSRKVLAFPRTTKPDNAANFSACVRRITLHNATNSALSKGLNVAVSPSMMTTDDILGGAEMAVETAEVVRKDT